MTLLILISSSFNSIPIYADRGASTTYNTEVNNDDPEVTFTATGIATEPSPINSVGYSASALKAWTNSSLDNGSILNTWAVVGDSLIAARRTSTFSPYSFPSSLPSTPVEAYKLKYPTGGSRDCNVNGYDNFCSIFDYVGNDYFIVSHEYAVSSYNVYLTNQYGTPTLITTGCGVQQCGHYTYTHEATDEIIIVVDSSYGHASSGYFYTKWKWYRYKLSDMRNGIVTLNASGDYNSQYTTNGSHPGYAQSGTYPTFTDGTQMQVHGANFDQDYKEINLSLRTVTSYKLSDLRTPYKVESYSNIPAIPKEPTGRICNSTSFCTSTKAEVDVWLTDRTLNSYGDYVFEFNGTFYKFDRLTGLPSVVGSPGFIPTTTTYSANGQHVWANLAADCSDPDSSCIPERNAYINLLDGSVSTYDPYPSRSWPYWNEYHHRIGQTGWGVYRTDTSSYNYFLGDAAAKSGGSLISSSDEYYLYYNMMGDSKYYAGAKVYSIPPETMQTPSSNEGFTLGQLFNASSQQVQNGTVSWQSKYRHLDQPNMGSGVSFRIQNHKNMYRVEATKNTLSLLKIVNGRKTTLASAPRLMMNSEAWVSYKVKLSGNRIKVYENGTGYFDLTDGTFSNGTMGPYSTADNTEFKGVSYQWSDADNSFNTPGVAIVDTAVTYATTFIDPENDPSVPPWTQWKYDHTDPYKFLDAGDGKTGVSSANGLIVTNPILSFDKVGLYRVNYRVPDDPHPLHKIINGDTLFQNYSKYSEWYPQNLIVHRRPLAPFTLAQDASHQVLWTDYSYDPDRCYNVGNCMSGYGTNHGVFTKKFYYLTPTGNKVDAKLVRPLESGTYTVAMAVADEYNAWSEWYEQTINIDIPAAPNNPPTVALTFPSGSQGSPSHVSLQPTITWNQWDVDPGTIFTTFNIEIKDEWGNCVECLRNRVMDTTSNSWSWTMDALLSMGQRYQVRVQVSDGESWSAWSNVGWMQTNTPPSAYMSFPYGNEANPNVVNTLRPTLTWTQTDPDPGAVFYFYEIQIANEANNVVIYNSGKVWQGTASTTGSLLVPIDLPTGQKMRVRVKVWDV
jgi:hypothetical protein